MTTKTQYRWSFCVSYDVYEMKEQTKTKLNFLTL